MQAQLDMVISVDVGAEGACAVNTMYLAAALVAELILAKSPGPPAAVVEAVSGNPAEVEFMDYVEVGKVIHLNSQDEIVLAI